MHLRPAVDADFAAILALNAESVRFLSPLDDARLAMLARQASLFLVVEDADAVVAFLLALREGADYDSPNYRWFAQRYARFLYVDRVVVSTRLKSRGAGTLLYQALFNCAARESAWPVTAEFDIDPPNPASERFHARFGFREVGRQQVAGGRKQVSLQAVPEPPVATGGNQQRPAIRP